MSVNFKQTYEWKGGSSGDPDFIRQKGVIYAWSESNFVYEPAWWLNNDLPETPLRLALRQERPLPNGEWQPNDSFMSLDGRSVPSFNGIRKD